MGDPWIRGWKDPQAEEGETVSDPVKANLDRLADHVETAQHDLLSLRDGLKKQTDRLTDCEEIIKRLSDALHNYRVASDGFAAEVRAQSGLAYPWPALEIAAEVADGARFMADRMLEEFAEARK